MIRELTTEDVEAYVVIRHAALVESPLSFSASVDDDFVSSPEAVRRELDRTPESTIFGAFRPELVGTVGIFRGRHVKASHKAHVWGMYVAPTHRRQGVGSDLLEATLNHARKLRGVSCIYLSVSSAAPEALALYERAGFQIWGTEPDALSYNGHTVAEYHMALSLTDCTTYYAVC